MSYHAAKRHRLACPPWNSVSIKFRTGRRRRSTLHSAHHTYHQLVCNKRYKYMNDLHSEVSLCTGCDFALKVEVQLSNLVLPVWGWRWQWSCCLVEIFLHRGSSSSSSTSRRRRRKSSRMGWESLNHSCRMSCCLVLCSIAGCVLQCDWGRVYLHHYLSTWILELRQKLEGHTINNEYLENTTNQNDGLTTIYCRYKTLKKAGALNH